MPVDPRLGALAVGTGDPLAQVGQDLADLRRRLDMIERLAKVQTGSGAPTMATRDGSLYIDVTNSRLYVRAASTWKFVAVT
jgi:hypothetical protein